MTQMNKILGVLTMVGLVAGLAVAGVPAVAQQSADAPRVDQGKGMMPPNGMMKSDMMTPEMQAKMARMMDNCHRMMESMIPNSSGAPTPPNNR